MSKPKGRQGAYETLARRVGPRIPPDVHKRLQRAARRQQVYMADLVRTWIEEGIRRGTLTPRDWAGKRCSVTLVVRVPEGLRIRLDLTAEAYSIAAGELVRDWIMDGLDNYENTQRRKANPT